MRPEWWVVAVCLCGCAPGYTTIATRISSSGPSYLVMRAHATYGELNYAVSGEGEREASAGVILPFKTGVEVVARAGWADPGSVDYREAVLGAGLRGPLGENSSIEIGVTSAYGDDGLRKQGYLSIGVDL